MSYIPPFRITEAISLLTEEICAHADRLETFNSEILSAPKLRRENTIRTIHSSLAIEQNTLSLEQVTAVIDGKRVLGSPIEIQEVQNAYEAYNLMLELDPLSVNDLLRAHRLMMKGLVPENGRFRSGGVGVFEGNILVHMAPPARLVPEHMANLFAWYRSSQVHPLVKSSVFHYEFEFIHPFSDGNGRLGRMWRSLLLGQWKKLFLWLPVEELIKSRQEDYYRVLGVSDREADSTEFIMFMLEVIRDSISEF